MNKTPKDFEQMGRDAWRDAGGVIAAAILLLGFLWLGISVPWIGKVLEAVLWVLLALVCATFAMVGVSMIWAAVAPVVRWVWRRVW